MNKDSRITAAIALLYGLNGVVNLVGPAKTFAPLVFLDSPILALLSLVFLILPPFKKASPVFILFAASYALQGVFITGYIKHDNAEIANLLVFMALCLVMYAWAFVQHKKILFAIPLIAFIATILMRYLQAGPVYILAVAVAGAMVQLYVLARPDILEKLSPVLKRFYLLMILTAFFDAMAFIFFKVNGVL